MYERNVGLRKRRSEPLLPSTEHKKGKLKLIKTETQQISDVLNLFELRTKNDHRKSI